MSLPGDGKRKKAVVQQATIMSSLYIAAALNQSGPPLFCTLGGMTTTR